MNEAALQRVLLARLSALPGVATWRSNSGVAQRRGGYVRFGLPGQGDISGLLRGGRRLEIECKSDNGRQSDEQKEFQARVESLGGLYLLSRDVEPTLASVSAAVLPQHIARVLPDFVEWACRLDSDSDERERAEDRGPLPSTHQGLLDLAALCILAYARSAK